MSSNTIRNRPAAQYRSPRRGRAGGAEGRDCRETILVVEDEPAVLRMATATLTRAGYRVLTAGSGVEAMALWKEHADEIDVLFTDLVMPGGIGGRELADALVSRRPTLRVVFTSGYSQDFIAGGRSLVAGVMRACLDAP